METIEKRPRSTNAKAPGGAAAFSAYTKALREAGVNESDLRLLRELAEMNARELAQADEPIAPSRVRL